MNFAEFKVQHGITASIQMYPSTTGSGRLVGSAIAKDGTKLTVVTKNDLDKESGEVIPFDKAKPIYVYPIEGAEHSYTLSNKAPKAPAMVL